MQLFAIFTVSLVVCVVGCHVLEALPMRGLLKVRKQIDRLYENFRGLIEGSKELQLNAGRAHRFVDHVTARLPRNYGS